MIDTQTITKGAHHVGLTVPSLVNSQQFFVGALKFEVIGGVPDYPAVFLSDGTTMITLWQAENPEQAIPFDRKNVIGLHHLAFTVDGKNLDQLYQTLDQAPGVEIEFAPEPLGGGPTRHFIVTIPGGIRVEFIAPA